MAFGAGFTAGFAAVFILKYLVFGLRLWNRALHRERIEPWDSPFLEPLLGIFSREDRYR